MHEETHDGFGDELPEELRDEKQVIVVHPDEVSWLIDLRNLLGVHGVGFLVLAPMFIDAGSLSCDILPEEVVEERPKGCAQTRLDLGSGAFRNKVMERISLNETV